ncbi:hypothetical protein [Chryseobacterium sp.]|uniref:hypothetical protein n=1 Tax=Chryseobacterium sp. TaxID=1871047 RepID=UPI00289D54AE|nr:hypothetical protein [Chryseobacterium sp.]
MNRKLFFVCLFFVLISCSKDIRYRWKIQGALTSLRLDDDGEYHFSTDGTTKHDIHQFDVIIIRQDTIPTLFYKEWKCGSGVCNEAPDQWAEVNQSSYKIVIPKNYKIETFDD